VSLLPSPRHSLTISLGNLTTLVGVSLLPSPRHSLIISLGNPIQLAQSLINSNLFARNLLPVGVSQMFPKNPKNKSRRQQILSLQKLKSCA